MKTKARILLLVLAVLLLTVATVAIASADGNEVTAPPLYEIYTMDPASSGAFASYTEYSMPELFTKVKEFHDAGANVWVVLYTDSTLTLSGLYEYTKDLIIDLNGHKLTMPATASDSALRPKADGVNTVIKNGTLTTGGSKVLYPYGNISPVTTFENLTIDAVMDFSDYRAGGQLTFKDCVINFVKSSLTLNRFIFFGQNGAATDTPTISSPIELTLENCVFNADEKAKFATSDGSILNFGNRCTNSTHATINNTTFNFMDSQPLTVFRNNTKGIARVTVTNSTFNTTAPLLANSSPNSTELIIGEGVSINKKCLDSMVPGNATVTYPADSVLAYVNESNVEYVGADQTVTVGYYFEGELLGERLAKIGSIPGWDGDTDLGYHYGENGLTAARAAYFYSDVQCTVKVAAITADTDKLYVGKGEGKPVIFAAFSGAPSVQTLVTASTDSNEIYASVLNTSVTYIEAYANVTMKATKLDYLGRSLTIDLGGNLLSLTATDTNYAFRPTEGTTFTLKNGTVESATARLAYPGGTDHGTYSI